MTNNLLNIHPVDVLKVMARESFRLYALALWPLFEDPKHLRLVIRKLEAVERGETKRLMIFMPPRHGKTLTASQLFPSWYLGRHPNHYVITTAYGEDLATDFGRAVRNNIQSPQHQEIFPHSRLSEDSQAAHRFTLTAGGAYYAVGRGGPITGRGAHLLLIDDPFKDILEASSEVLRNQIKEWYQSVAYTRLMPGGAVVIVTTRWHVDDLPGWLLREHEDQKWDVVELPALAEDQDPLGREPGVPLWPEKFPEETLVATRAQLEARLWLALYQQKPSIDGGYTFRREWFKTFKQRPRYRSMNRYIFVDPANAKNKKSDSTVMWVVGCSSDQNFYVLDGVKDRLSLTERGDALFRLVRRWQPLGVYYEQYSMQADKEYIEGRMNTENCNFTITPVAGKVSKLDRIRSLEPNFRPAREGEPIGRKVFFPQELWYRDIERVEHDLSRLFVDQEFAKYPAAKHDDMLDCLARINDPKVSLVFPLSQEAREEYRSQRRGYVGSSEHRGSHWVG